MDSRVVKLQVKVFLDGDEEHAITMSSDIFKTPGMFSSLSVPNVDFWIKDAARALLEGRIMSTVQSAPDPDLLRDINIMDASRDTPEINISESDASDDVVLHENQGGVATPDGYFGDDLVGIVNPELDKEAHLNITVTPLLLSDEQEKKKLHVIIRQEALDKAEEHARKDPSRETGGVMLGTFVEDETTITVVFTGIVRALSAVRKTSSVKFTPETWAEIWQSIDQDKDYSDENLWCIVGWYHTHPSFGIFLSGYDQFIQKEYFTRKGHLALVIDPVRKEKGFFVTNKATGETPVLEEQLLTYVKDDKDLIRHLNELQARIEFSHIPSSETHKDDGTLVSEGSGEVKSNVPAGEINKDDATPDLEKTEEVQSDIPAGINSQDAGALVPEDSGDAKSNISTDEVNTDDATTPALERSEDVRSDLPPVAINKDDVISITEDKKDAKSSVSADNVNKEDAVSPLERSEKTGLDFLPGIENGALKSEDEEDATPNVPADDVNKENTALAPEKNEEALPDLPPNLPGISIPGNGGEVRSESVSVIKPIHIWSIEHVRIFFSRLLHLRKTKSKLDLPQKDDEHE
jgi:proteasome lid subunit RPN8/RPN11